MTSMRKGIAGFIAGALAVAVFHQGMYFVLKKGGLPLQGTPWSLTPNPAAFGLPSLLNLMFWGGLWGGVYAFVAERIPGRYGWHKGIVFGTGATLLLGSWILVSLAKGRPLFNGFLADWQWSRLQTGFLLNGIAFGAGLGCLYPAAVRVLGAREDNGPS